MEEFFLAAPSKKVAEWDKEKADRLAKIDAKYKRQNQDLPKKTQ